MIFRAQAAQIANNAILAHGLGSGVREVYRNNELPFRAPAIYGGPDLDRCWIVYAERPVTGLRASAIVLIDVETGQVLYQGSANDEG
jgi:D-alanyl-D-alanine carboxypeptidase